MIFMNCLIFNGSLTFFRAVIMERWVGWGGFNVKYIGISPIGELRCRGATAENAKKWHWDKHQVKKGWKMFLLFTFSFPSLSVCSDLSLNWRLRCGGVLLTLARRCLTANKKTMKKLKGEEASLERWMSRTKQDRIESSSFFNWRIRRDRKELKKFNRSSFSKDVLWEKWKVEKRNRFHFFSTFFSYLF